MPCREASTGFRGSDEGSGTHSRSFHEKYTYIIAMSIYNSVDAIDILLF